MVPVNSITKGITRYFDGDVLPKMQDGSWQKMAIGVGVGVMAKRGESLAKELLSKPAAMYLKLTDGQGNVDIDVLRDVLHERIPDNGVVINVPLVGTMTFFPQDVDTLYSYIMGGNGI